MRTSIAERDPKPLGAAQCNVNTKLPRRAQHTECQQICGTASQRLDGERTSGKLMLTSQVMETGTETRDSCRLTLIDPNKGLITVIKSEGNSTVSQKRYKSQRIRIKQQVHSEKNCSQVPLLSLLIQNHKNNKLEFSNDKPDGAQARHPQLIIIALYSLWPFMIEILPVKHQLARIT